MAETQFIQKMAELESNEIFSVFGWERLLLMNQNWECEEQIRHRKIKAKTHPTDVVFKYVDPYSGQDVYVNADLKSYSKGAITNLAYPKKRKAKTGADSEQEEGLEPSELTAVLRSLAHSTECANKSQRWKNLYVDQTTNHDVIGMLFVYNHDGGYDANFGQVLAGLAPSQIEQDENIFVGVIGPKKVHYLNSFAKDIKALRGEGILPARDQCSFFFPHLNRKGATYQASKTVPLRTLLSSLFVLEYEFSSDAEPPPALDSSNIWARRGYYAYYSGTCTDINECKYLLDYFFKYQIAAVKTPIMINGLFADDAGPIFEQAKREFARDYYPISKGSPEQFEKILASIDLRTVQTVVEKFSATTLGMTRKL